MPPLASSCDHVTFGVDRSCSRGMSGASSEIEWDACLSSCEITPRLGLYDSVVTNAVF